MPGDYIFKGWYMANPAGHYNNTKYYCNKAYYNYRSISLQKTHLKYFTIKVYKRLCDLALPLKANNWLS